MTNPPKPVFSLEYIENKSIIVQRVSGEVDETTARAITDAMIPMVQDSDNPDHVLTLVDARSGGKATSRARKILTGNMRRTDVKKIAIVSNVPFIRALVNSLNLVAGIRKLKIFNSFEKAVAWLKK